MNKLYMALTVTISSLLILQSCVDEEFPSTVPTKPTAPEIPNGTTIDCSWTDLSISGAEVEDDLEVMYNYYLSSDNVTFNKVDPHRVKLNADTQYWWYAKSYTLYSEGEESDVFSFYCKPLQYKLKNILYNNKYSEGIEFEYDSAYVNYGDTVKVKFKLSDGYKISDVVVSRFSEKEDYFERLGYYDYFKISEDSTYYRYYVDKGDANVKFYVAPQFCGVKVEYSINGSSVTLSDDTKRYNVGDTAVIQIPDQYKNDYKIRNFYQSYYSYNSLDVLEETDDYVKAVVLSNDIATVYVTLESKELDVYASVVIDNDTIALPGYPKQFKEGDEVLFELPKSYSDYYIVYNTESSMFGNTSFTDDSFSGVVYDTGIGTTNVFFFLQRKAATIEIYVDNVLDTTIVAEKTILNTQYEIDLSKYTERGCAWSTVSRRSGIDYASIVDGNLIYSVKDYAYASIEINYKSYPIPRQTDNGKSMAKRYFGNDSVGFEVVMSSNGYRLMKYEYVWGAIQSSESYLMKRYDGFANIFVLYDESYDVYLSYDSSVPCYTLQITRTSDNHTEFYYISEFTSHDDMISNIKIPEY